MRTVEFVRVKTEVVSVQVPDEENDLKKFVPESGWKEDKNQTEFWVYDEKGDEIANWGEGYPAPPQQ